MTTEDQNPQGSSEAAETYGQILESSAAIGGSSALTIAFGVVRTKAVALLLGPAGFGLFGVYASIISVAECVGGIGVSSSAVRQIAQAAASGDPQQIGRTSRAMQGVVLLLAVLGGATLAMVSRPVSALTFGDSRHTGAVALLSFAVFFELLSGGQRALLQGMRSVRALAIASIATAGLGLLVTLPLVFFLREKGVVPAIIGTGLIALLVTSYFGIRYRFESSPLTWKQRFEEASALLKLGFVFMSSYLMTTGAGYLIRIMVLRRIGYEATGLYQAAWTIGGVYVGFILQAMGTDFYPRLTAVADDNGQCNRLVNEQTEVGLLLAGPGVLATFALAPAVLSVFFSSRFLAAADVLRWICLGAFLQVITWPLSYVLVAKGRKAIFFGSEAAWAVTSLSLAWYGIRWLGLDGAAMAFAGSYMVYGVLLLLIVGRLSSFKWSTANVRIGLLYLGLIAVVFIGSSLLPTGLAIGLGVLVTALSGIHSAYKLMKLVSPSRIPRPILRLFEKVSPISVDAGRLG